MIYVSQGHQVGIGVEIFLKSYLCLSHKMQSNIVFSVEKTTLINNLNILKMEYQLCDDVLLFYNTKVKLLFCDDNSSETPTLKSINKILSIIQPNDVIVTLPSSKDEFTSANHTYNGHTEYFRHLYPNNNLVMCFVSDNTSVLLLTDHIPLADVTDRLNDQYIYDKVKSTLPFFIKYLNIESAIFAGINPHAGENGLIGNGDYNIHIAVDKLAKEFTSIQFSGPISGDSLHLKSTSNRNLLVYCYHDQALAFFKSKNGFLGANITVGLDFLRISVDHGTAFSLYGKNTADYFGLVSVFETIEKCGHN